MMITFFSTQVGIERTIEPLQNMPFFIDERQLAGEGQAKINEVVYMIGTMRGKQRGKKPQAGQKPIENFPGANVLSFHASPLIFLLENLVDDQRNRNTDD